jgi:hypothetical protein
MISYNVYGAFGSPLRPSPRALIQEGVARHD